MADQRFDEKQIGAILQRATEIQSGLAPETVAPGVTLNELQKVAAEIGIEPAAIEKAAREIQTTGPKPAAFADSRTFDQTVDGILSDEGWDDLVTHLRQYVGRPGQATVQGNTREWSGGWDVANLIFTATSRDGKTRFRMLVDTTGGTVMTWTIGTALSVMCMAMAGGLTAKNHGGPILTTLVTISVFATIALTASLSLRGWKRKSLRKAARLFAALTTEAQQAAPALASVSESTAAGIQIQA